MVTLLRFTVTFGAISNPRTAWLPLIVNRLAPGPVIVTFLFRTGSLLPSGIVPCAVIVIVSPPAPAFTCVIA